MTVSLEAALAEWFDRTLAGEELDAAGFAAERGLPVERFCAHVAKARWLVGRHTEARGATAVPLPAPPFSLLDVEVEAEVGRGAMGIVFHGHQPALGREVAIKILAPEQAAQARSRARFLNEARASARIDHPHVARVFAASEQDGLTFLVMEWVAGETLAALLARQTDPPHEHRPAARFCAKLARALHAAHEVGLLHRDVKPANILVDARGEPKLVDFGLAKDLAAISLTATGEWLGSPAYASPEQISGGREPGPASDIWSLGVVLYECLTLSRPFAGDTVESVARRITRDDPAPPRARNASIPPPLAAICLKALHKSPGGRYASAAAFAADLEAFSRGEPVQARPPSVGERALRILVRHRVAASFVLLVAAVTLLFVLFRGVSTELEASERQRIEAEVFDLILWNRPEEYLRRLDAACTTYPRDSQLRLLRAIARCSGGRYDLLEEDLGIAAADPRTSQEVRSLSAAVGLVRDKRAGKPLTPQAEQALAELADTKGHDGHAMLLRGALLSRLGRWPESAQAFASGRFLEPRLSRLAAGGQIHALRRLGRFAEAHALFTPFVSVQSPAEAFWTLFDLAWQAGDKELATQHLEQLRSRHPLSALRLAAEIQVLPRQRSAFARAAESAKRAETAPDWQSARATVFRTLGAFWHVAEEHARAIPVYEQLLTLEPRNPEARTILGTSRIAVGDREQGLADLKTAAQIAEQFTPVDASWYWGNYHVFAGEFDSAIVCWRDAVAAAPCDASRWRALAGALTRAALAGKPVLEAAELLREAARAQRHEFELRPQEPRACFLLHSVLGLLALHLEATDDPGAAAVRLEHTDLAQRHADLLSGFAPQIARAAASEPAARASLRARLASSRPTTR